jgi:hypothetical protein
MNIPRIKSSDPRLNPSSKTTCQKCSERVGLNFAYANGKAIFLCERHYREWLKEAQTNKEMIREQPFKQVTTIDGGKRSLEYYYGKQNKKVW